MLHKKVATFYTFVNSQLGCNLLYLLIAKLLVLLASYYTHSSPIHENNGRKYLSLTWIHTIEISSGDDGENDIDEDNK